MSMTTEEIMGVARDLLGIKETPIDSKIHVPGKDIKKIIFALDVTVGLLQFAKEHGFDAVVGHHPCGIMAKAAQIYRHHITVLEMAGIPRETILKGLNEHIETFIESQELDRHRMLETESANRTSLETDMAALMNMPLMNIHNLFDEQGRRILQAKIDEQASKTPDWSVGDVISLIRDLPETKYSEKYYEIEPKLYIGNPETKAGKVCFIHGSLHVPHAEIIKFAWDNGIDTVVVIHTSWHDLEELRKYPGRKTFISTGHCTGDSIGFTPFITELRKRGIEVVCMGGVLDIEQL